MPDISEVLAQVNMPEALIIRNWGGSFSSFYVVSHKAIKYFIKCSADPNAFAQYEAETAGLEAIRSVNTLKVPVVISQGVLSSGTAFLCMEYIDSFSFGPKSSEALGRGLACMHKSKHSLNGWVCDNFISVLTQSNQRTKDWGEFYIQERLIPQFELAVRKYSSRFFRPVTLERYYKQVHSMIVHETPSLLHGDLWAGNVLAGSNDGVYLIDPAVYYGHREMDIAMTLLFGGFQIEFYKSYHENFPLAEGWKERMEIYQLYYLLVHLNLFGSGYLVMIENSMRRFV